MSLVVHIPVEVLAFRSDIAHTIVGFALPLTAGGLFLPSAHGSKLSIVSWQIAKVQEYYTSVADAENEKVASVKCGSESPNQLELHASCAPENRFSYLNTTDSSSH